MFSKFSFLFNNIDYFMKNGVNLSLLIYQTDHTAISWWTAPVASEDLKSKMTNDACRPAQISDKRKKSQRMCHTYLCFSVHF